MHVVEVKYCEDTRPRSQLEAAHQQHGVLCQHLRRAAANVSLHTILLGVGGTIYSPYSLEPLKHHELDPQKVTKLAEKLHAHSVHYAHKLPDALLRKLLLHVVKTKNGVLLVIPLIPTDFFCFL